MPTEAGIHDQGKDAQALAAAPPVTVVPARPPRCRGCGYLLVGQTAGRCPECGRAFDVADPRTVHFGRRRERFGAWVARRMRAFVGVPVGWLTIVAGLLATAAVLSLTRWPA